MKNYLLSRKYFKFIFIIYAFINTLALGYLGININWLSILIIVWGSIIILSDLIHKEIDFHDSSFILIVGYGLILLIATLLNPYSNSKSYLIALIQLLIFTLIYGNQKKFTKDDIFNELKTIIPLTNLLTGIAGFISLIMYIFKYTNYQNGWSIGMAGDRLFGVYFNCNPASFLSAIVIILALLAIKHKYRYTNLYLLNIVIQLLYIILTKCRASIIILAIIATALIYEHYFKDSSYTRFKKYLFSLMISLSIFLTCIVASNCLSYLTGNHQESSSRFQLDKIIESVELIFQGDFQPSIDLINQVSSGRIELLDTSIHIWQTSPIIGVGAGNFQNIGINETDGSVVKQIQVVHSHNVFVESLVTAGIIGAIIFVSFFVKSIKMISNLLKVNHHKSIYTTLLLFSLIVCSEFIGSLFDYGIFYIYSLSATLCWLFLGYLHYYD